MTRTFLTASITTCITGSTAFLSFAGLVLFLTQSGTPDELPSGWMVILCLLLGLCVLSSGMLSLVTCRFVADLIGESREEVVDTVERCRAVEGPEERRVDKIEEATKVDYYQELAEGFERMSRW